ncbi:hypothetical protein PV10_04732 [Exophiala mesophila]|uniref:Thioredoxin domain-containing protein n=1 Tax=Exophiala mesophila TaxID=212818 RepID=A0A0D1ZFQ7_EXOME|nr:uncharacterized protein PV10_04732 [Exophiala mesophila]KIV93522.1 hypothetical protein PV10_04732 [Exophiala mesophila]
MDVQLYVYDLSQGMARQFSQALTGVQIDAIYHTSIVYNNVEYFFGQGIHRKIPGSTHHGSPMKIISMGSTQLPPDVIDEYVASLESIYTPESYDLFVHNCNNFSQDLAMFLTGKSIPEEISSLPETFLRTPMGQMLRGQIDQSMRSMTQAPDAVSGRDAVRKPPSTSPAPTNGYPKPSTSSTTSLKASSSSAIINSQPKPTTHGRVYNITTPSELDTLLATARDSCAVIFFTSATCPPCKIAYPTYDELAGEAGELPSARLIKIDISASHAAQSVAQRYQIRATPTFVTFLKGKKQDEWSGANPSQLRGNVRLLFEMAKPPQHQHAKLKLPSFQRFIERPMLYTRTPPLEKLLAKTGAEFSSHPSVQEIVAHIKARDAKGSNEAPLPNLHQFSHYLASSFASLPADSHFAVVDLVRVAALDPRVSSFLITDERQTILNTLFPKFDQQDGNFTDAKFNIQSVTIQLACNLFSSIVFQEQMYRSHSANGAISGASQLRETIETLAAQCLLSPHANARSMAAALVYNLGAYSHNQKVNPSQSQGDDPESSLGVSDDVAAALIESISSLGGIVSASSAGTNVNGKETLHALLLALGVLLYGAPADDMLWDLCRAMEVRECLAQMAKNPLFKGESLLKEVGEELLGKGAF